MNNFLKNIIILILLIGTVFGIYLGALIPLAKSQSFIRTQQQLNQVKSVDDFKQIYDTTLLMNSPVGQEEVVKFSASTIGDLIGKVGNNEPVARWLVAYIEPYLFKNELRHLLLAGNLYEYLWRAFGNKDEDFKKAEMYYQEANKIGPKIPPPLYRLVSLYQTKGDQENVNKYAKIILENWDDPQIRALIK